MARKSQQSATKRSGARTGSTTGRSVSPEQANAAERVEEGRWAIIKSFDEDSVGGAREEVINICIMNPPGAPPEMPSISETDRRGNESTAGEEYSAEQVPGGVMIGMVRGGPEDAVGGFGFPEGSGGKGDRFGPGAVRLADAGAKE
jgi:hypothetical protein